MIKRQIIFKNQRKKTTLHTEEQKQDFSLAKKQMRRQ